jgi:hypothetical protein
MIVNDLSSQELKELLVPFFRLAPKEEREYAAKKILQYDFASPEELRNQKVMRFCYKGFSFKFESFNDLEIYIVFSAPKNLWPSAWMQTRHIVNDLVELCKIEIPGIEFKTIESEIKPWLWGPKAHIRFTLTHLIESRRVDMIEAKKDPCISPTVICYYLNETDRRAEFKFTWSGYRLQDNKTIR